jgi:IS5 family transposase
MARCKKVTPGSFFGDYLCEIAFPEGDFLLDLKHLVDWETFRPMLLEAYKGKAERGESPYDPVMLVKMLFLAYIWNLSERRVELLCRRDIIARNYLGVSLMDPIPDHSTLSLFRKRLQDHNGSDSYSAIFDEIIRQSMDLGVTLGSIQVVDSVHTEANVDRARNRERRENGEPSTDPDATIVHKGKRTVVEPDGKTHEVEVIHLGYKTHVSMDADTGIVTSIKAGMGETADNEQMPDLIAHDTALGVPGKTYAADRAYDDGDIIFMIEDLKKHPAIRLKDFRTVETNENAAKWLAMVADPYYQAGCAVRYRIERKFAEAKLWHGFRRCRYRGLLAYKVQAYLTFAVLNLKRIVYLLAGSRPTMVKSR